MANIEKPLSERDANQTLQSAYNLVDASLTTNGFLVGKVGNKIVRSTPTSVTEQYSFYDGDTLLYTYLLTYTASDLLTLISAERTA